MWKGKITLFSQTYPWPWQILVYFKSDISNNSNREEKERVRRDNVKIRNTIRERETGLEKGEREKEIEERNKFR